MDLKLRQRNDINVLGLPFWASTPFAIVGGGFSVGRVEMRHELSKVKGDSGTTGSSKEHSKVEQIFQPSVSEEHCNTDSNDTIGPTAIESQGKEPVVASIPDKEGGEISNQTNSIPLIEVVYT